MNPNDSGEEERFNARTSPRPLVEAVVALCASTGQSLEDMETRTPSAIFHLAEEYYGQDLPEFWRIWKDWHEDDDVQPMGDL